MNNVFFAFFCLCKARVLFYARFFCPFLFLTLTGSTPVRQSLAKMCTDVVQVGEKAFEGCVKHQGSDTRPRPQAGAVCVREKTQGQKHLRTKFHFAQRCGEWGSISLERAQGKGGGSSQLTCAGTALDSKSESVKVRADYKLLRMPTSLLPFHSHQARF